MAYQAPVRGLQRFQQPGASLPTSQVPAQTPLGPYGGRGQMPQRQLPGAAAPAAQPQAYDPTRVSPALRAALERRALRSARNRRQRGSTLGRMVGLDPYQQRISMREDEADAGQQAADFINEGELQEMLAGQQFGRQQTLQQQGFAQDEKMMRLRDQLSRQGRGGLGSMLGQLLGMGAGAFLPGVGGGLAGSLWGAGGEGAAAGASPRMGESGFRYPRG